MSSENHAWFHKQSKEAQSKMNQLFQEYKKCGIVFVEDLDVSFAIKAAEIIIDPELKKEKYNRAKEKREFERRIEEELEHGD